MKRNTQELWNKRFIMAKKFYLQQGHLKIPEDYIYENVKLGRWLNTQKYEYKKRNNPCFTEERIKKLESIGICWDVKKENWDKMYNELKKYKRQFKSTRVPQSYITKEGLNLGAWINKQRLDYKENKMSNIRKKKLDKIGMIWNAKELVTNQWDNKFELVKQYKNKYNKFPSFSYITKDNIKLGAWLSQQRQKNKQGKLEASRKRKLDSIGIIWDVVENNWDKNYNNARNFFIKYGYLEFNYEQNKKYNKNIQNWLCRQRQLYKKGKLSKEKIQLLKKINISWDIKERHWHKMYNLAREFFKNNNHITIPRQNPSSEYYRLGLWIETQRKNYKSGKLSNLKKEKLDEICMIWNLHNSKEEIWENWYSKAKDFYTKNNHLNPPKGSLCTWIEAQRAAKKGLRGTLSNEQIKKLENIGISWEPLTEHWYKMYNLAKEYYKIHNKLDIPVNYITENNEHLGIWICTQRKYYKNKLSNINCVSQEYKKRLNLLNEINMIWDASLITTKTSFQEKTIFYYLKQIYKDVKKISMWEYIGYEFDIFIPSIKVAIEYDGIWHKDSLNKDLKKNEACLKNNIELIRIREPNLPKISNCKVINLKNTTYKDLEIAIKKLFKILNAPMIYINITKDKSKILETYKNFTSHNWDKEYKNTYLYYKEYKDINNIKNNTTIKNWINMQRRKYKNNELTKMQIEKLEKLNIDWGPLETKWKKMYILAKKFYIDNGNLSIPYNYISENNMKLGAWLSKQKENYKKQKLSLNHIHQLEKIAVVWSVQKNRNKIFLEEVKKYYKKYGNIDIPINYKTNNIQLGKWLATKRKNYQKNKLSKEEIDFFESMKIKWNIYDENWNKMFEIAKKYYLENGHIWISPNYITEDGIHLGRWISLQRKKANPLKNLKPLTNEQTEKLNSLNMIWNAYEKKWFQKYELAKAYYKKYGNLNVKSTYITENNEKLGMWISTQRQAQRGNPNYHMTPKRKQLLDEIGMDWKTKKID